MGAEIDRRLGLQAKGSMLPFAVIDNATGKAVGHDHLHERRCRQHAASRSAPPGTAGACSAATLNTACKLLLLAHAFETLDCIAVEFRTHFFNHQSRRGIERLGAKLDGILRNHQLMPNGTLRDTCVYSIIAPEWPTVKAHLTYQLSRPRD